eukprot:scaffold273176_cov21-Tisochrysis_lutea.AAC.3
MQLACSWCALDMFIGVPHFVHLEQCLGSPCLKGGRLRVDEGYTAQQHGGKESGKGKNVRKIPGPIMPNHGRLERDEVSTVCQEQGKHPTHAESQQLTDNIEPTCHGPPIIIHRAEKKGKGKDCIA